MGLPNQITITQQCSGLLSAGGTQTYNDNESIIASPVSVLAAQPAVLTTHTTNTTGSLTITNANHGITTGQRLDIYWAGGQCFNAVAGTVAGAVVPIASVSGGSNLPASSTPVTVGIPYQTAFNVIGNNLTSLILTAPHQSYFVFDASAVDDLEILLPEPPTNFNSAYMYGNNGTITNPLASYTITSVWMSHSYVTGPVTANFVAAALTH